MNIILIIAGLAVLILGGEFLVKGAVGVAERLKLSSLVIGMTVVSFGTSAPELIVSIKSALSGNPDIAIGNVVGSNIANIALVLGITVIIFPLLIDRNSKFIDWPMMMFASLLFYIFSLNEIISFLEGIVLFLILIAFVYYIVNKSRKELKYTETEDDLIEVDIDDIFDPATLIPGKVRPFRYFILFISIGLILLYFGSEWLLEGAVNLARDFGMEERVIGITIVAIGTSVPELVTSAVAAFRKETGISIGNLIGSNIFNIMAVLGITAIIKPINVSPAIIDWDIIWMLGIALMLFVLMIAGKVMGRFKGVLLIGTYLVYIVTLL